MGAFFVRTMFGQLFSSYMYVEKAAEMMFVQKIGMKNVDENDTNLNIIYLLMLNKDSLLHVST